MCRRGHLVAIGELLSVEVRSFFVKDSSEYGRLLLKSLFAQAPGKVQGEGHLTHAVGKHPVAEHGDGILEGQKQVIVSVEETTVFIEPLDTVHIIQRIDHKDNLLFIVSSSSPCFQSLCLLS